MGCGDGEQHVWRMPGLPDRCCSVSWDLRRMSLNAASDFLAGTLPKPIPSVEPMAVVTTETNVTILCEGTSDAQEYSFYKQEISGQWVRQRKPESGNKAKFHIPSVGWQDAGRYQCYYRVYARWSECSDTLELVVTGENTQGFWYRLRPQEKVSPKGPGHIAQPHGTMPCVISFNTLPSSFKDFTSTNPACQPWPALW